MIIAYRVYKVYRVPGLVEHTLGYFMSESDAEQVAQHEIQLNPEHAEDVIIEAIEIK